MADDNDPFGGYTLEQLLGASPLSKSQKQQRKDAGKRGPVNQIVGAPFRLVVAAVSLPVTLVTRTVEMVGRAAVGVIASPVRLVARLVGRKN